MLGIINNSGGSVSTMQGWYLLYCSASASAEKKKGKTNNNHNDMCSRQV